LLLLLLLVSATSPAGAQDEDGPTGAASDDREVLLPIPSEADDAAVPEPSTGIDEMVVRGTGRDDFLKDLSISGTSFSAAEIKSLRIQNIADLAEYTPNLEINTRSAASNPTLFIRGIGLKDYNANAAGAVAVYQNGININSPAIQLGQLFDTEEILVLRGPQGSVNGRNATAGAIHINSVLPDGERDVWGSVTYGNYNNVNLEGAIALPLVEDLLSTRLAFTANWRDGTTKNHCADWDPESIDRPRLTMETIEDALDFKLNRQWPENPEWRDAYVPDDQFPREAPPSNPWFKRDEDDQERLMAPDAVCIENLPGQIDVDAYETWRDDIGDDAYQEWKEDPEDEAWWEPGSHINTLETFQGLKHYVNNVDNWAIRGILRFQPDVNDGMDWILNAHGGQNLGDSSRLQSLSSEFMHESADPYLKESLVGGGEVVSIVNSTKTAHELETLPGDELGSLKGLEGIREIDGFYKLGEDRVPGGRGGSDIDAGFYDLDGLERLDAYGLSLQGLWDTGPVNLVWLTGYEWYERRIDDEGDATAGRQFPAVYEDSAWQLSQELRAEGEGERYRWFVGGFFLYEDLDSSNLFPSLASRRIEQEWKQRLTSAAGYANGRYWVLDEVYLDAGIRYNYEHKEFTLESTINALEGGQNEQIPEETLENTWTAPTGEAVLGWEPGGDWMYDARLDHLNLYIKYGRGFKGGHFNAGLTVKSGGGKKQRIDPVEPEFIHAVELGFKSRWLQNRLVLNFALFRYWYTDLQVFDYTNEVAELPIQKLLNSDASVLGAEMEIQARPLPGLLLQFAGGWLDTEFLDFKVAKATSVPRGVGDLVEFDYSGHPLISAPEWSASGVVEYQIPLGRWGSLVPQYSISYRSKVYVDPQMLDPISQGPVLLQNARLAYRSPNGRYEIAGWVENFTNERYKIDSFDLSLGYNSILEVWNEPRMFGVTVSAYF
jgi:outer membrane receptor protein involved in Fe transport